MALALSLLHTTAACESAAVPEPSPAPAPALRSTVSECEPGPSPLRTAHDSEARALTHIGHYPFSPSDGLLALDLLSASQRCFAAAGQPLDAARVAERLARWQRTLDADYRGHQVRLQHALRTQRTADALAESRALLAMLATRDGAYTAWLRHIEQAEP
jgi:hypothetical protein